MPFQLAKPSRLWSIDADVAMVVTDLHGDRDTYARYRDRFIDLCAAGQQPQDNIFCSIRRVP
jgi:hypothetical protein